MYDGVNKLVSGYIYYNGANYAYYTDLSTFTTANLPSRYL